MKLHTLSLLIITLVLTGACSQNNQQDLKPLSLVNSKLISDRPQNVTSVVTIIKLKERPLFAELKNGKIDPELKDKIVKEQKETLEKLKGISEEIKLLYSYRFVMNALAVATPVKYSAQIKKISTVHSVKREARFHRPETTESKSASKKFGEMTSVKFIKAHKVHDELNVKGQGMRVGIIDTGIDYTHAMFGGEGTEEAYKKVDPTTPNDIFPSKKVVGGIDLVGSQYIPSSIIVDQRIPKPDMNPLDEAGHGTHVAGTVAGLGDNVNTYDGVAPAAELFAIKVFGKKGGTGEAVIIAGLEYAADPNGDLDPSDKLDVVNLSLGGSYGKRYNLYREAATNLVNGGIVMVASAGNSGHEPYIVGSPGTTEDAISVAASVDGMEKNWKFDSISFTDVDAQLSLVEVVEGDLSKPVAESKDVKSILVFAGIAATDFSDELKESLKGNIALIDRGEVSFIDKLKRAYEAGAIGVVVANNKPGAPFGMGGDEKVDLPAIMVSQAIGSSLKEKMKKGDVIADFGSEASIGKPHLIDTLTSFSSRGPRSNDSLIKPEVAAPGFKIISAAVGTGTKAAALNGTSMSAPHVAGVMALLKQHRKELSARELKTVLMNTSELIKDSSKNIYPVAMQGAGRVDTYKAATSTVLAMPYSVSLGETSLLSSKKMRRTITLKNLSEKDMTLATQVTSSEGLKVTIDRTVVIKTKESKSITVDFLLQRTAKTEATSEEEAYISFKAENKVVARVPVLAVIKNISKIAADNFKIHSSDILDSEGALVTLDLKNQAKNKGEVLLFNTLGTDSRKPADLNTIQTKSRSCDLQKAGYRIVTKNNTKMLQFGFKLFSPVSRWQACEISIQIDSDGDSIAEQELGGISHKNLEGMDRAVQPGYYSVLLDAVKARKIRSTYETAVANEPNEDVKSPNYLEAILDSQVMTTYSHSTVAIVEVDLAKLKLNTEGQLRVKMGVLHSVSGSVEYDDYLGKLEDQWLTLSLNEAEQGFVGLPEKVELGASQNESLSFVKGAGGHSLMILAPMNLSKGSQSISSDHQSLNTKPVFLH